MTGNIPARPTNNPAVLQERVDQLVRAYRVRGHRIAHLDPLGEQRPLLPELDPAFYGLGPADMDRTFSTRSLGGEDEATLRRIISRLRSTYCRFIGVQFMHIDDLTVRMWLQERMENSENRVHISRPEQLRILTRLTDAVMFEEFIQKRYLGAKSFSLEGSESLIPLLDMAIEKAGEQQVVEITIAMAHRGRLNVLANILGKSPQDIFHEFEDVEPAAHRGRGDVKYHLGYSSDYLTAAGHSLHLSLCFNPSHLEFVNPVAMGRMRAKQDRDGDEKRLHGLVLMIHGDASFAGEGVIQETLNLSQLPAYTTGGALHVVVNNQLGFTTPPEQARSSMYATDVAKMLQIPIFHVNGEDPESVAQVVNLALDFQREFRRDVVIDMYCYRRRGHNEGDEPSFTQPLLYRQIEERLTVRESYLERLLLLGGVTCEEADKIAEERRQLLEDAFARARTHGFTSIPESLTGVWTGYIGGREANVDEVPSGCSRERLSNLLTTLTQLPEGFHPHPKIERFLAQRHAMSLGEKGLDWSAAEALALASVATDGIAVRMSGQDCERGTFSQRHAVLHDVENGEPYMALEHLDEKQAKVEIYNSPLSEVAVLGFEYGYSLDQPAGLVMWEAQYGDFVNVAAVIIDQFIVSAEDKWRRLSGLVMLLPHGLEGSGPEHSSARLERFLTLAAEDNIQIAQPSTPAQYFHLLRRQALRRWRKPLVVMTPKSLLRHAAAVSTLEELAEGTYRRVLPDAARDSSAEVRRVLLCSGKVYYELDARRRELGRHDVAIVRLEQFYPCPYQQLRAALAGYRDGTPVVWVQEEPENMGAWWFLRMQFGETMFSRLPFSGIFRRAGASPATGSASSHRLEQDELIAAAFGGM
jgi:2-oxoglutarate dehydrogenase E1 component